MAVTIKSVANDVPPEIRKQIDALGHDEPVYRVAQQTVKDYEARKKALIAEASVNIPDDQERLIKGDKFILALGAAGEKRELKDLARLIAIMGPELFLQVCKVNIGDIVQYVPEHQLDEVLKSERSGARSAKFKKIEG
jgi:hypothetical protein